MYFISWNPSFSHLLHSIPVLIPDSDNPFPVTGTGIQNCIPKFWEREREWKIAFPTFGNGNGNEKIIPNFREREWEAGIPGNGREREFPLTPDVGCVQRKIKSNFRKNGYLLLCFFVVWSSTVFLWIPDSGLDQVLVILFLSLKSFLVC